MSAPIYAQLYDKIPNHMPKNNHRDDRRVKFISFVAVSLAVTLTLTLVVIILPIVYAIVVYHDIKKEKSDGKKQRHIQVTLPDSDTWFPIY